jgi:hypothetical protein
MGFQGLVWIKVAAGMYYFSYVILAFVAVVSSAPKDSIPLTRGDVDDPAIGERIFFTKVSFALGAISVAANTSVCVWAIYRVFHFQDLDLGIYSDILRTDDGNGFANFIWYMVYLFTGVMYGLLPMFASMPFIIAAVMGFLIWLGDRLYLERKLGKIPMWTCFVLWEGLVSYAFYRTWLFYISESGMLFQFCSGILQGGGILSVAIGVFLNCVDLVALGCRKAPFLREWEPTTGWYLYLVTFALTNLVVAALYLGRAYDPQGTVKPAWTEDLG